MALPKLASMKYELTIPSTTKRLNTVRSCEKEERFLLIFPSLVNRDILSSKGSN